MSSARSKHALRQLALDCGIQVAYYDILTRRRRAASAESLVSILRALGVPLEQPGEEAELLRKRTLDHWNRLADPVLVAWEGRAALAVRIPAGGAGDRLELRLELESGEVTEWTRALSSARGVACSELDGVRFEERRVSLGRRLPAGYHRLTVRWGKELRHVLVISAPRTAYRIDHAEPDGKLWGLGAPIYSLRSERNWGAGDFTDLAELLRFTRSRGGEFVLTLPFLTLFANQGSSPSPYSPVSRLFWNEFYIDIEAAPEFATCDRARALANSARCRRALSRLRALRFVDYDEVWKLKREMLQLLAAEAIRRDSHSGPSFGEYREGHPLLADYARFRAFGERQGKPWRQWPSCARAGEIPQDECEPDTVQYHQYVQYLAWQQVRAVSSANSDGDARLMLDLPVGVHPDGFDAWRFQDSFAAGAWTGAPPDRFFVRGQSWRVPPPHPWKQRAAGYEYFIRSLRHNMSASGMLRLDHVMGLHRLFWIPEGAEASDGVYVRYPSDETFAILTLESHRNRCVVVGENLGTVPREVQQRLRRHRILGTAVLQFGFNPSKATPVRRAQTDELAAMNTHDTPTFAGFWKGKDIVLRRRLNLLNRDRARRVRLERQRMRVRVVRWLRSKGLLTVRHPRVTDIFDALSEWLARGCSPLVLVSLEDLWGSEQQQNIPGIVSESANWSRKLRYTLEEIASSSRVGRALKRVDRARKDAGTRR